MNQLPTQDALVEMTLEHWQEHRPTMYRELQQSGQLQQRAESAAALTLEVAQEMVDRGQSPAEAWAETRHQWCLIPSEDELESLAGPETIYQDEEIPDLAQMMSGSPPLPPTPRPNQATTLSSTTTSPSESADQAAPSSAGTTM